MFVSVGSCYFREPACHHFVNLQGQGAGEAALFGGRTQEEQEERGRRREEAQAAQAQSLRA